VASTFYVPTGGHGGEGSVLPTSYQALVISPGLAVVELGGRSPYAVITGATDTPDGDCVIRLTLALPRAQFDALPPPSAYEGLLRHSRRGLEEDRVIWENLASAAVPSWTADDGPALAFFRFCETFRDG
jgi:hypothetical protein